MLGNSLLWNIIILIATTIEWMVFRLIIDELSERKKSNKVINILIIIIILIIYFLTIENIPANIKLGLGMIMGYLFYFFNYKTNKFKAIIVNLSYWTFLIGLDFISLNFVLTVNQAINIHELFKNNIFNLELIVLSKSLLVSIIPVTKGLKNNIEFKKNQVLHITILITANILSIVVIFNLSMTCINKTYMYDAILLFISSIIILSNISLIKIIGKIVKANNIEMENKLIKDKMNMQYHYYLNIQEAQLKVRKLYHDMNNHIVCIKKLYGCCGEVKTYIDNVQSELNIWKSIIYTGNMILDIIVNDKKKICEKNNINFEVDINFSKCNFIDMIDVCSIFSNLIDNAIEACIKANEEDKFIILKGKIVNEFFIVKCENSKSNKIKFKKGAIVTDKGDEFMHGIGIRSIKNSVKKYEGEVCMDFHDEKFTMKIYIPLK